MDLTSALRDALAAYLRTALAAAVPGLEVSPDWPTPGRKLPANVVTVLVAGEPETRFHPPRIYRTIPGVAPMGAVRYAYGRAKLPLQLDAWATSAPARDALAAALAAALHRHPAATLVGAPTLPRLGGRGHLVLAPATLLGAPCEYRFEGQSLPAESGDAAQSGEWRASWAGVAETFVVTEEQLALMRSITVLGPVGGVPTTILIP
jgi:hypothetical protein